MSKPETPHWEGMPHAPEGSHRTVGQRAWADGEWCYPDLPCQGCMMSDPNWMECPTCDGGGYISQVPTK